MSAVFVMGSDYPACHLQWWRDARYSKDVPEINAPSDFLRALDSLKDHRFRPELHVTQIPPPKRIAPWAVALQAEVNDSRDLDPDTYRGNAKFVLLYDPEGQPAWDGQFRIVAFVSAPAESDVADDPLLGEVAWSWLAEALRNRGAPFHNLTGTVTRIYNETFGGLTLSTSRTEIEIRASWSPDVPDVAAHLLAWADFAAAACGLGPVGVAALPPRFEAA
ncbi:MAG: DUF3000 domain-containing protein [Ancrocorticia sp.]|nr:DUF3000 domain-containing protein [Ancrocorticia sp.]MCI1895620.1 DUF3000 domain-containing protein [Ancrocorticia sp.]MCI1932357.1 DUF3000 domain-containing protein [Ancrocorticia sp.]MCI1962984.1 DUF3000 domain-containing protein [Ancrocorticia sp.]MCI2001352.1 DUF3000 domain-containing protein [Ancrocorticia sp.]